MGASVEKRRQVVRKPENIGRNEVLNRQVCRQKASGLLVVVAEREDDWKVGVTGSSDERIICCNRAVAWANLDRSTTQGQGMLVGKLAP